MNILPVIDLMAGAVVRGVGGRRAEYRPIVSPLCASSEPLAIARAVRDQFGLCEFYLADLDAIAGQAPAECVYRQLSADGFALWIDAGLRGVAQLEQWGDWPEETAGVIVAGLETLPAPDDLRGLVNRLGPRRIAFSLDLKAGAPLTAAAGWQGLTPLQIAALAANAGVRRMIVLDLADVGASRGVGTLALCRELYVALPLVEIIAGGGVRGPDDLREMRRAGCQAALVASALHDGRLKRCDLHNDQA